MLCFLGLKAGWWGLRVVAGAGEAATAVTAEGPRPLVTKRSSDGAEAKRARLDSGHKAAGASSSSACTQLSPCCSVCTPPLSPRNTIFLLYCFLSHLPLHVWVWGRNR
jgi:hypothetical protein